jgi:hypothetical protein
MIRERPMTRRDVLQLAVAAAGMRAAAAVAKGVPQSDCERELLQYLCPPDGFAPPLSAPSPEAAAFAAELFVPPIKQPVQSLDPPPDPRAHQKYDQYLRKKFYERGRWSSTGKTTRIRRTTRQCLVGIRRLHARPDVSRALRRAGARSPLQQSASGRTNQDSVGAAVDHDPSA